MRSRCAPPSAGPRDKLELAVARKSSVRNVLVVDVGGTSVKILATGQTEHRSFPSGPTMTPKRMVSEVKKLAGGLDA